MKRENRNVGDLGAYDVTRAAFNLLRNNSKKFFPIYFTFILPSTIISLTLAFIGSQLLSKFQSIAQASPPNPVSAEHINHLMLKGPLPEDSEILPFLRSATVYAVFSCLSAVVDLAFTVLWVSSNLYAMGLIYRGVRFSFFDILRAIPRLWRRLLPTQVFAIIALFAIILLGRFLYILVSLFGNIVINLFQLGKLLEPSVNNVYLRYIPATLLSETVTLFYDILWFLFFGIFVQVIQGVSIFEESHGWAPLKKCAKLVQGKKKVAFWVILLGELANLGFVTVQTKLLADMSQSNLQEGLSKIRFLSLAGSTLLYVVAEALANQFFCLLGGVLYVSCKAHHNEELADWIHVD